MTSRLSSLFSFLFFCTTLLAHNYNAQGICTDDGCAEPYQQPELQDGWYLLANAGNVEWFSAKVNAGGNDMNLKGKLTADIDMNGVTHTPIGVGEGTKFNGQFDGQQHRILNLKLRSTSNMQAFFGGLRGGGTVVKNLIMDKSCTISGKQRVAGIVAFAQTVVGSEPVVIENCINEASVTGSSTGVGGILGGSLSPHPAIILRNCINTGVVRGAGESASIAGWLGDNAGSRCENCYNTGRLVGIDGEKRNMVRSGGAATLRNLYEFYKSSTYTQGQKADWITSSPLTSGELCHFLSGGAEADVWRQTLGTDEMPLPFGLSERVYLCGKSQCDGTLIPDASFFSNSDEGIEVLGHSFLKGHCTMCGTLQPGYPFPPRKVFLMAGQSNADGRPAIGTMPDYIQAYAAKGGSKFCYWSYANGTDVAWQMFGGKFQPYMPYTDNNSTSRCGFDGILYHLIEEALGERFYVIKESRGGTAIDTRCSSSGNLWWYADADWLRTASPRSGHSLALEFTENIGLCIDNVLSRLDEGYEIECILWHQGESDRTQSASYHDNLRQLVGYLRSYIAAKTGNADYLNLPFIAGTVNRKSTQYNAEVEAAVLRLAQEDENFHVVDMSDCKLGTDNLHFDATGCIDAAGRMFSQISSLGLLDEEDPTDIKVLKEDDASNYMIFNLSGQRLSQLRKGVNIVEGRKILVK